jgi:prolyl-tRNA synthetase family I
LVDSRIAEGPKYVAFHPMQNDATTAITREDMHKIIHLSKHTAEIIDFSKLVVPAAGEKTEAPPKTAKHEKPNEGLIANAHQLGIEYQKEKNFSKWY